MSLICSNEFADALTFIANQPETIERIKNQFDLLISLQEIKSEMIEPTLISISTHNQAMGDWIVERLLSRQSFEKHSALAGKIIVCDQAKVAERLFMLLDHILKRLKQFNKTTSVTSWVTELVSYIQIFVKTVHLVAPDLSKKSGQVDFGTLVKQDEFLSIFNCYEEVESTIPEML